MEQLIELDSEADDFVLTFTGKKSKKVDGLYKPESREILIHNKNFADDNALMYTAIHEFAHHIQFSRSSAPISVRAHTNHFWNIFHSLLFTAEEKKIFTNIFKKEQRFIELTKKLKEKFLTANGKLMKEFGGLLIEAYELCRQFGVSFEDYVDRELQIHRSTAKTLIKMNAFDINPDIGYENMKLVAKIKEPEMRGFAEAAFAEGKSPDMVKAAFFNHFKNDPDSLENLIQKKEHIERNIERLTLELEDITSRIEKIQ
ncbi:MAG: hypothetical protein V1874_05525 [Spirochaetota bacterium]